VTIIYNKVALIGLGLIASSMGHGMKREGIAGKVIGYSKTKKTRDASLALGFVDAAVDNIVSAIEDADLIVLCVPVGAMSEVAKEIGPRLKLGATITDVGSVKQSVIEMISPHIPDGVYFVPGHPLAGTEHSGPASGFADLFKNRWCILTPAVDVEKSACEKLQKYWEALGANVEFMDAEHHDLVLAVTSHAPHLIAYTMVGVADDLSRVTDKEVINFSAAGFRDFTRIAASDPTMWRDVFLNNKEATLEILGRFTEELFDLQRAIRRGDGDQLFDYFSRTRAIRRGIIDAGRDTDAANFVRGDGSDEQ